MQEKKLERLLKRIGCGLSRLRQQQGFSTIKRFAVENNLPAIHYWRIEKGFSNLRLNTLVTLLSIHNMDLEGFFLLVKKDC